MRSPYLMYICDDGIRDGDSGEVKVALDEGGVELAAYRRSI